MKVETSHLNQFYEKTLHPLFSMGFRPVLQEICPIFTRILTALYASLPKRMQFINQSLDVMVEWPKKMRPLSLIHI